MQPVVPLYGKIDASHEPLATYCRRWTSSGRINRDDEQITAFNLLTCNDIGGEERKKEADAGDTAAVTINAYTNY